MGRELGQRRGGGGSHPGNAGREGAGVAGLGVGRVAGGGDG